MEQREAEPRTHPSTESLRMPAPSPAEHEAKREELAEAFQAAPAAERAPVRGAWLSRMRRARRESRKAEGPTIAESVRNLSEGMNQLVRGHLDLARAEMAHDFRAVARDMAMEIGGAPVLLIGYLLMWLGIGFLLGLAMQPWLAFLICAAANFLIGGALLVLGRRRMQRDRPALRETTEQLRRDRGWINTLAQPPPPAPRRELH